MPRRTILSLVHCLALSLTLWLSNSAEAQTPPDAKTLFEEKKYSEVIQQISSDLEKASYDDLLLLGKAYSEEKNSMSAIKTWSLALLRKEKSFEAKTLIGREYVLMKKEKEALPHLKEALEWNPKYEPAYDELEKIYIQRGNKYELRTLFADMVEKIGEKPRYIMRLCELYYQSGLYDIAIKTCRRGIILDKSEAKNYVVLAQAFRDTGKVSEAINLMKKSAEHFPQSLDAQFVYAHHLEEKKDFVEAIKFYRKAVALNKDFIRARIGLATCAVEVKSYQEGLDEYTAACKMGKAALIPLKKSIQVLRGLKEIEWAGKYEALVDSCGYNL